MGIDKSFFLGKNLIQLLKQIQWVLLILVIVSLPFSVIPNSWLMIFLTLVSIIIITQGNNFKFLFKKKWKILLLTTPFIFTVISLLYSPNIERGLFSIEKELSFLIFPIIFWTLHPISTKKRTIILDIYIYTILAVALMCALNAIFLVQHNGSLIDDSKLLDREYYYFTYLHLSSIIGMNPIYLAMYVNFALFILMDFILIGRKRRRSILLFLFLSAFLLLLSSKINILFYLLFLPVTILTRINSNRIKLATLVSFLILIFFTIVFVKPVNDRILNINYFDYDITEGHIGFWNGANLRLAIWSASVSPIQESWILGYGVGAEHDVLQKEYQESGFKIGLITGYNAHNQWISYALRFGLIFSIVSLVATLIIPAIQGWRYDYVLFVFIALLFSNTLTEVVFSTQKGIVFFGFFFSLLIVKNVNAAD
jgi:O-antigen ligase